MMGNKSLFSQDEFRRVRLRLFETCYNWRVDVVQTTAMCARDALAEAQLRNELEEEGALSLDIDRHGKLRLSPPMVPSGDEAITLEERENVEDILQVLSDIVEECNNAPRESASEQTQIQLEIGEHRLEVDSVLSHDLDFFLNAPASPSQRWEQVRNQLLYFFVQDEWKKESDIWKSGDLVVRELAEAGPLGWGFEAEGESLSLLKELVESYEKTCLEAGKRINLYLDGKANEEWVERFMCPDMNEEVLTRLFEENPEACMALLKGIFPLIHRQLLERAPTSL